VRTAEFAAGSAASIKEQSQESRPAMNSAAAREYDKAWLFPNQAQFSRFQIAVLMIRLSVPKP
jgi:hypothetical protein